MDLRTTQMAETHLFLKSITPTRFTGLNPKLKTLYIFKSKVPIIMQSIGGFSVAPHQFKVSTTKQPCGLQSYKPKTGHAHFAVFKEDNNMVLAKKGSSSLVKDAQEKDNSTKMSTKLRKKRRESPEGLLRRDLDMCSKRRDLVEALRLYDNALEGGVKFEKYSYNVLLYICSSAAMGVLRPAKSGSESNPGRILLGPELSIDETTDKDNDVLEDNTPTEVTKEMQALGLQRGFEIYEKMSLEKVPPDEATFTSVARLAAAKGDGDLAFNMVKQMAANDVAPKLRSYSPALFTFCKNMEVEKAYEVDYHMKASGVEADEPELEGLLKLSVEAGRESKVYSLLHRLRASVRQVNLSTANVIEEWFNSKVAAQVGTRWNAEVIRKAMESRGGGWHGMGWVNKGEWSVKHTNMTPQGVCRCCGEQLVTIDIDPMETERFAKSVADLATQRERKSNFTSFQEWLADHGPYEVIIDGANVGLYRQSHDGFFPQLNAVINGIRERSPSKRWPLVILYNKRTREGPAELPQNKQLINKWKTVGALYTTPTGSNDDWYWLYAAVKFKCLIVTVDEMRDHIFQILGNDFFPKWKERHQVRFTLTRHGPEFYMPPPYSIVIQESERGSWHIPIVGGDDIEIPRKWLCITRPQNKWHSNQSSQTESQLDSKLSKIKDVHGALSGQSDVTSDRIKVPRVDSKNEKDLSDMKLNTESTPFTAEVSGQKNRLSLSSQFKRKKNRQQNSPSEPSSSPASETLKKIEAAEKHVDFAIDFQI